MDNRKNNKRILGYKQYREKGAVLFIAITVSSLVLMIGIGMLNVMTKEMVLGSFSVKSREAFYAADSGVECAMHWDLVQIIDDKHPISAGTYSTSTFPIGSNYSDRNSPNKRIGADLFTAGKFNPFCAGQEADKVFDAYLQSMFGIAEPSSDSGGITTTQFVFFPRTPTDLNNPDNTQPCTLVTVEKKVVAGPPDKIQTKIYSEGFSSCNENDPRRVSRGVLVQYEI